MYIKAKEMNKRKIYKRVTAITYISNNDLHA